MSSSTKKLEGNQALPYINTVPWISSIFVSFIASQFIFIPFAILNYLFFGNSIIGWELSLFILATTFIGTLGVTRHLPTYTKENRTIQNRSAI